MLFLFHFHNFHLLENLWKRLLNIDKIVIKPYKNLKAKFSRPLPGQ